MPYDWKSSVYVVATVWADPYETITAAGADDGYTGLNLSRGVFGYNQTATRLIRDNTHAVKGARLRADTGLLVVIEVSSVNARHGVNVPKSWGNPVASYVRGGKTRLAYRIDHGTTVTFTPETALRKRVFHNEGTPTYHGRYLPFASADPEADVARLRAANWLHRYGDWYPLFLHYDANAVRVSMSVMRPDGNGNPAPQAIHLTVDETADLIEGLDDARDRPLALLTGGGLVAGAQRFRERAAEAARSRIWAPAARSTPILLGALGGNAGAIGAAWSVLAGARAG